MSITHEILPVENENIPNYGLFLNCITVVKVSCNVLQAGCLEHSMSMTKIGLSIYFIFCYCIVVGVLLNKPQIIH